MEQQHGRSIAPLEETVAAFELLETDIGICQHGAIGVVQRRPKRGGRGGRNTRWSAIASSGIGGGHVC